MPKEKKQKLKEYQKEYQKNYHEAKKIVVYTNKINNELFCRLLLFFIINIRFGLVIRVTICSTIF